MNTIVSIKSLFIFIIIHFIWKQIYINHTKLNRDFLIDILTNIENAKREYRNKAALKIIKEPKLFPYLVNETFCVNDILSVRAAWVLEWVCTHNGLDLLLPHLSTFTKNLHKLHFDGSLRCCAKICEHISVAYTSKNEHSIKTILNQKQIDTIVAICFDWLITPQKIAVKAYTMNTLYLFGLTIDWIHPALADNIQKDILHQSKGCEARGKKIIALIQHQKNKTSNEYKRYFK